ncbi:MarR family transcriptional regulator [Thermoleophilia bacterium SCSIO 60948]|nr:MarR family transcriptional regulator [Thermoleophilia bacterium SCSIO 60948]
MEGAVKSNGMGLSEQLCFALYAASRAATGRYRSLLDPLGLTYPQYLVMLVLWERGATTIGELGEQLQLDSGTISPLVKRLEGAGIVSRRRAPEDERSVLVEATDRGIELQRRAEHVPEEVGRSMGLDYEQRLELRKTLMRLAESLDAATPRD